MGLGDVAGPALGPRVPPATQANAPRISTLLRPRLAESDECIVGVTGVSVSGRMRRCCGRARPGNMQRGGPGHRPPPA
jgi:hypothetical protein